MLLSQRISVVPHLLCLIQSFESSPSTVLCLRSLSVCQSLSAPFLPLRRHITVQSGSFGRSMSRALWVTQRAERPILFASSIWPLLWQDKWCHPETMSRSEHQERFRWGGGVVLTQTYYLLCFHIWQQFGANVIKKEMDESEGKGMRS